MVKINSAPSNKSKWTLLSVGNSIYHMNPTNFSGDGLKNLKFVSADGHHEAVYNQNGNLLTQYNDSINMGTYNYASPYWGSKVKHLSLDVIPYEKKGKFLGIGFGLGYGNVRTADLLGVIRGNENRYYESYEAQKYRNNFLKYWKGNVD